MSKESYVPTDEKARRGRPAGAGKRAASGSVIGYREALALILSAEAGSDRFTDHELEELPPMRRFWLQATDPRK